MDLLIDATREFLANGTIQVSDIFGNRFDTVKIFYSTPERYTQCKHVDLTNAKQDEMAEKSNSRTTHDSNHNDQETSSTSLHRQPSRAELSFEKQSDKINVRTAEPKFNPLNWSVKKGDFFPYADCDHCYWTGYFTSRQGLKRLERVGSSFLHTSRQIESMLKLQQSDRGSRGRNSEGMIAANKEGNGVPSWPLSGPSVKSWNSSPLYTLEEAMGVAQHHDAVAGTSKQHVAYDYAKQIASGMSDASVFVTSGLRDLLLDPSALSTGALENLSYCHLHNETICDVSQVSTLFMSYAMS